MACSSARLCEKIRLDQKAKVKSWTQKLVDSYSWSK